MQVIEDRLSFELKIHCITFISMTNQTHTPDVPVMYYIRPNISNLKLQLLKMLNTKLSPSFCMASQSHICHTILQKCHTNDSHKGLYQIPGHEHLKVHSAVSAVLSRSPLSPSFFTAKNILLIRVVTIKLKNLLLFGAAASVGLGT